MTERFEKTESTIEKFRIYDHDKEDAYFITCDEHTVDCLTDLLNELNDENEILKDDYSKLCDKYKELKENWEKLSEEFAQLYIENKELKSEKKVDNINWFKDAVIYVNGDEDKIFDKLLETAKFKAEKNRQMREKNDNI